MASSNFPRRTSASPPKQNNPSPSSMCVCVGYCRLLRKLRINPRTMYKGGKPGNHRHFFLPSYCLIYIPLTAKSCWLSLIIICYLFLLWYSLKPLAFLGRATASAFSQVFRGLVNAALKFLLLIPAGSWVYKRNFSSLLKTLWLWSPPRLGEEQWCSELAAIWIN